MQMNKFMFNLNIFKIWKSMHIFSSGIKCHENLTSSKQNKYYKYRCIKSLAILIFSNFHTCSKFNIKGNCDNLIEILKKIDMFYCTEKEDVYGKEH